MEDKYTFTCIARIEYWNNWTEEYEKENITFTGISNFTEAMTLIESWYGKDLEWCDIRLLDSPFIIIADDTYKKILEGKPV